VRWHPFKRIGRTDRWHTFQDLYWHRLVVGVIAVWGAASAVEGLAQQFTSTRVQSDVRLGNHIPHLSGWEWLSIWLLLLLILGFESTVRKFRKARLVPSTSRNKIAIEDPVVRDLVDIHNHGSEAKRIFETSESNLAMNERLGRPPPQGNSYDEWHERGERELREWLSNLREQIKVTLGTDAETDMNNHRDVAPLLPVPYDIRGEELWLDATHRLNWIAEQIRSRDARAYARVSTPF